MTMMFSLVGGDGGRGRGRGRWARGHFLYGAVQGCAAGIGILFMPEII